MLFQFSIGDAASDRNFVRAEEQDRFNSLLEMREELTLVLHNLVKMCFNSLLEMRLQLEVQE